MTLRTLVTALGALLLVGCAQQVALPPLPPENPTNPHAAEAPAPAASEALSLSPPDAMPAEGCGPMNGIGQHGGDDK